MLFCISSLPYPLGDGKTHYIESQLKQCPFFLRIAVNEAFTPLSTIQKLSKLPLDTQGCAVFFNFTMLPPGVRHTISGVVVAYCAHVCWCAHLVWHSVCREATSRESVLVL